MGLALGSAEHVVEHASCRVDGSRREATNATMATPEDP